MTQGLIVVGDDGSPSSQDALRWGLEVAGRYGSGLELVRAWEWAPPALDVVLPDIRDELRAIAERDVRAELEKVLADRPTGAPAVRATARAVEGEAGEVLVDASTGASLLVVGRHGASAWRRRLPLLGVGIGSVTSACLARSAVPTVVATRDAAGTRTPGEPPARIVVGIDGSAASIAALRWAVTHAPAFGAPVTAVLTWQLTTLPAPEMPRTDWSVPPLSAWEDEARQLLTDSVNAACSPDEAARVQRLVLHRPATAGLLETVGPDDLLVLGERGRGGFARLMLGSVTRQCVEHASCSVVVVPGSGPHRRVDQTTGTAQP